MLLNMNRKRSILITVAWVSISFIYYMFFINKQYTNGHNIITIGGDIKVAYKTVNMPYGFNDRFISLFDKNGTCDQYIRNGVIDFKYEYNNKLYDANRHTNFNLDSSFKDKDPLKIILKTKKDINKCEFEVSPYPGKLILFLKALIFTIIPFFLVLINIIYPIYEYIMTIIIKKIGSITKRDKKAR